MTLDEKADYYYNKIIDSCKATMKAQYTYMDIINCEKQIKRLLVTIIKNNNERFLTDGYFFFMIKNVFIYYRPCYYEQFTLYLKKLTKKTEEELIENSLVPYIMMLHKEYIYIIERSLLKKHLSKLEYSILKKYDNVCKRVNSIDLLTIFDDIIIRNISCYVLSDCLYHNNIDEVDDIIEHILSNSKEIISNLVLNNLITFKYSKDRCTSFYIRKPIELINYIINCSYKTKKMIK